MCSVHQFPFYFLYMVFNDIQQFQRNANATSHCHYSQNHFGRTWTNEHCVTVEAHKVQWLKIEHRCTYWQSALLRNLLFFSIFANFFFLSILWIPVTTGIALLELTTTYCTFFASALIHASFIHDDHHQPYYPQRAYETVPTNMEKIFHQLIEYSINFPDKCIHTIIFTSKWMGTWIQNWTEHAIQLHEWPDCN